jgi:hypothetical protein
VLGQGRFTVNRFRRAAAQPERSDEELASEEVDGNLMAVIPASSGLPALITLCLAAVVSIPSSALAAGGSAAMSHPDAIVMGVPAGMRPGQPPLRWMLPHGFGLGTCCKLVQFHFSMSVMCLSWLLGRRVASPTAQA